MWQFINVEYSKSSDVCGSDEVSVWNHIQMRERARTYEESVSKMLCLQKRQ